MIQRFIERPVLSMVISILIVLVGLIAMTQLPVTQYPDIAPPEVTVTTSYTGANAEAVVKAVVTPLERSINGVPGMTYMNSVSGNDGTSVISIIFEPGTDPDIAAVNVQNRVSSALDELPEEVIKSGVIVEKVQNSMLMYLNIMGNDTSMDEKFLYNFTDINILPELKRINGVGFLDIMGAREYAMRIWLKPDRMLMYSISANEITEKLKQQNVEAAPGKVGESSGKNPQSLQYVLRYTGKLNTKEAYENIPLKSSADGKIIRLSDVARVEFDSQDYNVISKENGKPSAAIMIKQRSGTNAQVVIDEIKTLMEEMKETRFPPGIEYTISYDVSEFLDASMNEVIKTLIEAFILVALVVFIFLQDFRSTLIPIIAVPVSLVGTFTFMLLFGFSINLITLFALVLAIGIVVDNAIVVVEAIHAKMEETGCDVKEATIESMKEISGAIIAITLVMSAVFVPAAFMPGSVGIFYKEFSLTMAVSIVISGITALTLTPALCILLLKKPEENKQNPRHPLQRFFRFFNHHYGKLSDTYSTFIGRIASRRIITFAILIAFSLGSGLISNFVPSGFLAQEDQGTIYANITTPVGATLERTEKVVDEVERIASELDDVQAVSSLAGYSLLSEGNGSVYGMNLISLKNWKDRAHSDAEIMDILNENTSHIKDAQIEFFTPPPVPGYGNSSGFELRLLDKSGLAPLDEIQMVSESFVEKLNQRPEIQNAFTTFNSKFPQYLLKLDLDKAAQKGITAENAMQTLQSIVGSEYATNFIRFGQLYRVMVQALPEYRANPDDILKLYIKNEEGEMLPFSSFMEIEKVYGPEQITRYNMYTSAMINGQAADGYSSGDVIKAIKECAEEELPGAYGYDWAGATRDQANQGNEAVFILGLSLLFVYLLLAAQYESFLLPLPVILSLPTGIFGSYFFLGIWGLENNIYAQIAMIMLMGILGKNAILIVEFAILKNKEGSSVLEAAIEGARSRLRPILMTSIAFMAGLLPLLMASGAGKIGNQTIGAATIGGMLWGTIFGLIIIPGLYVIFASIGSKKEIEKKKKNKEKSYEFA